MAKTSVFHDRVKVWLGKDLQLVAEVTVNEYGSFVAVSANPDPDARIITETILLMVLHTFTKDQVTRGACLDAGKRLGINLGEPENVVSTPTDEEQRFPF